MAWDNFMRVCGEIDPAVRIESAKRARIEAARLFFANRARGELAAGAAAAIVGNSITRFARNRRGSNLNPIYQRISRFAAEFRSTRSRSEGSRLAVDRERWTGAASIIWRLRRNFAHGTRRTKWTANSRQTKRERKRGREFLACSRNTPLEHENASSRNTYVTVAR